MTTAPVDTATIVHRAQRRRVNEKLRAKVKVGIGGSFLVALILASAFAPLPHDPERADGTRVLLPPNADNWFGTDRTGFDVFSRTVAAAHIDLLLAFGGTVIALVIGTVLGLLASGQGRWSSLFMRGLDTFQAFPMLILILVIVSLADGGNIVLMLTIGLASLPEFIRLVRSEALVLRSSKYVQFAEITGASRGRVLFRHLLPNVSGVILAQMSLGMASAVGVLAAVSFLGEGVAPPTPSWGAMIQGGASTIGTGEWWPVVFPALALTLAIFALNAVSDGMDSLLRKEVQR